MVMPTDSIVFLVMAEEEKASDSCTHRWELSA